MIWDRWYIGTEFAHFKWRQIEEKKDVSEGARVQNVYTNVYARNIIQIVYYLLSVGSWTLLDRWNEGTLQCSLVLSSAGSQSFRSCGPHEGQDGVCKHRESTPCVGRGERPWDKGLARERNSQLLFHNTWYFPHADRRVKELGIYYVVRTRDVSYALVFPWRY